MINENREISSNNNDNNQQLRFGGWVKMEADSNDAVKATSNNNNMPMYQYVFTSNRSNPDAIHSCTFHLISLNSDYIEQYLNDVSNPTSKNYGKHLTKQQIDDLTIDHEGVSKVLAYLKAHDITVTQQLSSSITCESSITKLELLFNTVFYDANNINHSTDVIHRAHEYYLPSDLVSHVSFVSGIMHLPVILHHGPVRVPLKGQLTVQGRMIG